jgi:hypothetical protein
MAHPSPWWFFNLEMVRLLAGVRGHLLGHSVEYLSVKSHSTQGAKASKAHKSVMDVVKMLTLLSVKL